MADTIDGPAVQAGPITIAPSPAAPPTTDDEHFTELRSLILGPEQRHLAVLQEHVFDAATQTRHLSRLLPDAVALRGHDPDLARALAPSVEDAITSSVHRDPRPLADALFPVMGPAIRKAIEHMLSSMMESFNRSIEQSLSWRSLQWRLTAWRTGKPFAEIVLLNTLQYRVEQVFLIHGETGLLLQHATANAGEGQDADQVSAMLTAIRDFVRDSFKVGQADHLDTFRVGDLTVIVEQGPFGTLAAAVRGNPPGDIRDMFRHALEKIHLQCGLELKEFQGDSAVFERIRPILEECLVVRLRDAERAFSYRRWVAIGTLAVLLLGVWAYFSYRERARWAAYLDRLAAEPGVTILSSGRRGGQFFVNGLRDPLATDPTALLAASQLAPSEVDGRWQPYQAIAPAFVTARAVDLLRPPAGVSLAFQGGTLTASGPASERWLVDSERLAPAVAGVERFEYAGTPAEAQIKARLESTAILFDKGHAEVLPQQLDAVADVVAWLNRLDEAVRVKQHVARIEILGHTDNDGSDIANEPLSQARADVVRRLLRAAASDVIVFSATGVGSTAPVTSGTTESEKVLNRRASFRVTIDAPTTRSPR